MVPTRCVLRVLVATLLAVFHAPAAELQLNWTRALTPRLSPEDMADLWKDKEVARAAAPVTMVQLKEGCTSSSSYVKTGEPLGEGGYAAVYKVRKKTGSWFDGWFDFSSEYYAMKVPFEGDEEAEDAAVHEIQVMTAAKHCSHVLPLLDENPCIDGKQQVHAFVTKLYPYDFQKWLNKYENKVPEHCYDVVLPAVRSGLDCMHKAGFVHGDLKPDNVLFESYDADGCPSGISLADFGLSHEIGKPHLKFPKEYYLTSWEHPGTQFNGVADPFKLTKKIKVNGKYKMHYMVDARMDECSLAMLMFELFKRRVPSIQEELGKGACGPMGPERKLLMP